MNRVLLMGQCKSADVAVPGLLGLPPLGLHRLAAWIGRMPGVEAEVYDPCISGMPDERIYVGRDFIGFSPLADTLAADLSQMNVAHRVNPDAEIIVGGIEATLNYQTIFEKAPATWIVLGYGERPLAAIVEGKSPAEIDGVIYRQVANHMTSDDLASFYGALDFGELDYERYWNATASLCETPDWRNIRTVRLVTATHCNRGCTFCSVTRWYNMAVGRMVAPSMLSADQMIELVKRVKREVPTVETIYLCEDDVCYNRRRIVDFCKESGVLGVSYLIQTHSSHLDKELVAILAAGGVRHISLGIENASPNVLRSFKKPQRLDKVPQIIEWCRDYGITPFLFIIFFAPDATVDDLRINCRVLREWLGLGATLSLGHHTDAYPGADLYDSAHDFIWDETPIGEGKTPLRQRRVVLPSDPTVRSIMGEFDERWDDYRLAHGLHYAQKGELAPTKLDLIDEIMSRRGLLDD